MSRSLVTGGAGFVGKSLVKALKATGRDVVVLDLVEAKETYSVVGSIMNPETVRKAFDGVSEVFHLAGNAQLWAKDEDAISIVNIEGTRNVVRESLEKGVAKFVYCSSLTTLVSSAAPIGASSVDEGVVLTSDELIGAYPKSKRLGEIIVEEAVVNGLNASVALPTEPLGPGDEAMTPPTQMIVDFLNGKTPASINCLLNFVPVGSLAEGFVAIADKGKRGERYLLGGENVPMAKLLANLEIISGRKMPTLQLPYGVALLAGFVDTGIASLTGKLPKAPLTGVRLAGRRVTFSSAKAESELGWQASPFLPALEEAVAWMRENELLN